MRRAGTPTLARSGAVLALAGLLSGCAVFGYPAPVPRSAGPAPAPRPAVAPAPPVAANPSPAPDNSYVIAGQRYFVLSTAVGYQESGLASWYGDAFAGHPTSSGETYDPRGLTAAHRTLPLATRVEVTNLDNGARVVLRINDRGPFADPHLRIIDVSQAAARLLGFEESGLARVEVRAITGDAQGP